MKTISLEQLTQIRDALLAGSEALTALITDVEASAQTLFPSTEDVEVTGTDEMPEEEAPAKPYRTRSPKTCRNRGYVKKHHIVERIAEATGQSKKVAYYVLSKEAKPGDLLYLGLSHEQYAAARIADSLTKRCIKKLNRKRNG